VRANRAIPLFSKYFWIFPVRIFNYSIFELDAISQKKKKLAYCAVEKYDVPKVVGSMWF